MNGHRTPAVAALDRLVDGELAPAERAELLAHLEATPDGWRRCALAFLEAQSWREALARPAEEFAPASGPSRFPGRRRKLATGSALAAGLLLTFGLGLGAGRVGRVEGGGSPLSVRSPPVKEAAPHAPPLGLTVGAVDVADAARGEAEPDRVPILAGPGLDEQWLSRQPSALPEYVRAQWERSGYHVEQSRRLVAVDLEDGRRVTIPVDQVDLRFSAPEPN